MQLVNETMIYLYSDGFIDQNDKNRKRLGSDTFKRNLNDISTLKCSDQEKALVACLDTQLEDTTQRDDILVLGLRINPADFKSES